ncbi:MAG: OsmC family protein [Planctomycetota bacterium]
MTAPFPHHYRVELDWETSTVGMLSAPPRTPITTGPPPEFDGSAQVWSPEHLLLGAASACLMSTFLALARRARLAIDGYRSLAEGTLEKTKDGIAFARIDVRVELSVTAELATQALELLQAAKQHCIITNSLRAPVHVDASISTRSPV